MTATAVATADAALDDKKTKPKKPAEPRTMFVIDTTATPDAGQRVHHVMVDGLQKPFTFKTGDPLELPAAIAHKFLKDEAFVQVDKDGNRIAYKRTPKQPDELGAGETLQLTQQETVARYDELSTQALYQRVSAMIGGERFAKQPEGKPQALIRDEMIAFIIKSKEDLAAANKERKARQQVQAKEETDEFDLDDDEDLAA
ncbi:MAG: hypothetical protein IT537_03200 [Hyphomicrobiales bacterium]|nr:hypothetical protein [Hyphomicrobiales bacterium]